MAPTRRGSRRRPVLLAIVAALVLALAGVGIWWLTRPAPVRAAEYDQLTVTRSTQTDTVALSGTIHPQVESNATFRVAGTVAQVLVKVGDTVPAGAPLASVGTRDLADAVALAEANAAAARAQLTTVKDSGKATDAQIEAARAQVRSADASLTNAQNRLADATLASPIAGTVARVGYEVGDQVTGSAATAGTSSGLGGLGGMGGLPGLGGVALPAAAGGSGAAASGIVVIATDAWQLDASVGTADLPSLKPGQEAVITPTGTSQSVHGVVDTVGIVATQVAGASATFPVTLKVTDAGARLYSGSSADAVVTTGTHAGVLAVPSHAVTTVDGVSTVEVVQGGTVAGRPVTVGKRFGATVEVVSGLAEGDVIRVPRGQVVQVQTPRFGPPRSASPSPTPTR